MRQWNRKVRFNNLPISCERRLLTPVSPTIAEQQHELGGSLSQVSPGNKSGFASQTEQEHPQWILEELRKLRDDLETERNARKQLQAECSSFNARLKANTKWIGSVARTTDSIVHYIASQVLFSSLHRSLIDNAQKLLVEILQLHPPTKSIFISASLWRKKLKTEVTTDPNDQPEDVDIKRLEAARVILNQALPNLTGANATWIKNLLGNDLAMHWISQRSHKFKHLGNDAAHPTLSAQVWAEVLEHMHHHKEINEEEKESFLVLVDVTGTLSAAQPKQ